MTDTGDSKRRGNLHVVPALPAEVLAGSQSSQPDTPMKTHFGVPRRPLNGRTQDTLSINWRRGLIRVWLLASAAWLMGWAIYLLMYGLRGGFKTTGDWVVIPVLLFGPPVALLLFGLAAGWAFRGFKTDEPPPAE